MASSYPTALDTLATNKADATTSSTDHPNHHNDLADAVNKIETELGINPKGNASDVATRLNSRDLKDSCRVASTSDVLALLGGTTLTIDGVALSNGDRVFLKDQTDATQNGIYTASGIGTVADLNRATDANTAVKLSDSMIVTIEQGTVNADTIWELTTNNPITLNTTPLYFTRIFPDYATPMRGLWMPSGAIYEAWPRNQGSTNSGVLTSGTLRLACPLVIRAGIPITSISFCSATTAAATPTNQWFCLVAQSDRKILAVTANDTTTAWASQTSKTLTIAGGPYTPLADMAVWVGAMVSATTVPSLAALATTGGTADRAPITAGNSNTGQTTPMAVGTVVNAPTTGGAAAYCYLS